MRCAKRYFVAPILCLLLGACQRSPVRSAIAPLPPPPAPVKPAISEAAFAAGRYSEAAQYYETYLKDHPDASDRDLALFKLGLSYALAGRAPQDIKRAQLQFRTLLAQFPDSRYRPEAEYILSLQAEIEKLEVDVWDKRDRMREKDDTIRGKDQQVRTQDERIRAKNARLRDLDIQIKRKEEKIHDQEETIRRLTEELDQMKKIDLVRRPSRPQP